jgi:hypothetical protein
MEDIKMKLNTYAIDKAGMKVTTCHLCQTLDGTIELTQTFEYAKCTIEQQLMKMTATDKISWRNQSNIKKLTTAEAQKFNNITIDCSAKHEKAKHVETPEEKETRLIVSEALKSGKLSMAELKEMVLKAQASKNEVASQAEMEAGEK